MLAQAALDGSALECGAHWPSNQEATDRAGALAAAGRRRCTTIARESIPASCAPAGICRINHPGYVGADHPYQEMVRRAMAEVTGAEHGERNRGIDGCSIPTYAVPLRNLATGFARMATGKGLSADRAERGEAAVRGLHGRAVLRCRNRPRRHRR